MADVAIVMAVISGLNLCLATFKEFNEFRKQRKDSKAVKALDKDLDQELEHTRERLNREKVGLEKWIAYTENRSDKKTEVSSSFERNIKHKLDSISQQQSSFKKDMDLLRKLLEKDDELSIPQINKLSALIKLKTREMKVLATTQYKQISIGLWNHEALPELPSHKSRHFCPGALRLQNRKLPNIKIADIAVDYDPQDGEFVCRYCSLQVGNKKSGAESHLMGSASFGNFKALYKCLPCYMAHEDKDFGSFETLRAHILSIHGDVDMQTWKTIVLEQEKLEEEEMFETGELAVEFVEAELANISHEVELNEKVSDENGSEASMEDPKTIEDDRQSSYRADRIGIDAYYESRPSQYGGSDYSLTVELPLLQDFPSPSGGAGLQRSRVIDPMRKKKR